MTSSALNAMPSCQRASFLNSTTYSRLSPEMVRFSARRRMGAPVFVGGEKALEDQGRYVSVDWIQVRENGIQPLYRTDQSFTVLCSVRGWASGVRGGKRLSLDGCCCQRGGGIALACSRYRRNGRLNLLYTADSIDGCKCKSGCRQYQCQQMQTESAKHDLPFSLDHGCEGSPIFCCPNVDI